MIFEELHNRYGHHVAQRVRQELDAGDFARLGVAELPAWLETRAEAAHKEYQTRLENPFVNEELGAARTDYIDMLYRRWQDAEELAYLVAIAEDVSLHAGAAASGK